MTRGGNVTSIAKLRGKVVETGQDVEIAAPRRRKRKRGWRDHVAQVDLGLMQKLELVGGESRVFFTVCAHIPDHGGCDAFITPAEIAEEMGVSQPYIFQILKVLKDRRIIWKVRNGRYHVSAWLVYNGDYDSWNSEADIDPEPVWARGVNVTTGEMK